MSDFVSVGIDAVTRSIAKARPYFEEQLTQAKAEGRAEAFQEAAAHGHRMKNLGSNADFWVHEFADWCDSQAKAQGKR